MAADPTSDPDYVAADAFVSVMGVERGRALCGADFAEEPLSYDARVALARILADIAEGKLGEALYLLRGHAHACLPADAVRTHSGLGALRRAVAERVAADVLTSYASVTADFLHLAGVRPYTASTLLVSDVGREACLHVWPTGMDWANIDVARRSAPGRSQLQLACGASAADQSLELTHAPRGAWAAASRHTLRRCSECERHVLCSSFSSVFVPVAPDSPLPLELAETVDAPPLPAGWEGLLDTEFVTYGWVSDVEDTLRRLLGALSRGEKGASVTAESVHQRAALRYCGALKSFTYKSIELYPRRALARVLAHPRRLFCDTVRARALTPALISAFDEGSTRFDERLLLRWAPTPESTGFTARQRHYRCADAADLIEDQLCYKGGPSTRALRRGITTEPDMEAPAKNPASRCACCT